MAPRKQQEIFDATLRLVAERGYDGLTVEGVAERSGVNKTTIYRWWPSKAALLGAALVESDVLGFDSPDTGSLRGDLVALVEGSGGCSPSLRAATSRWPRSAPPYAIPSWTRGASSPTGSPGSGRSSSARWAGAS
ncbi:TetR/AcrR family transcriptional regulator [Nonomuraea thailandensis]